MASGLLLIRLVFGLVLAGHGAQKLFGWFGGGGPRETAGFFEQLGFRLPFTMAVLAGLGELGGGVLLAAGLVTPLAGFTIAVVMLTAIATVHWSKGLWVTNGGYEYNLSIITAGIAVAAIGPGRYSLDHALGWTGSLSGVWWGVGAFAAAAAATLITLTVGRTHTLHAGPATQGR